ncbi:hypothetical protein KO516_01885 [Citreicella sp. C3M06]|uniref:hypothetical protein n=1 Tax=Citreicella sp. C3M06 TaxID=2841564 RepID=UPI001C0A2079|nr:hypothetical protein [Citreicella sp. C3M06]MBU2959593.1 hypothetical protein [Citreicella sp. C3M06]
MSDPVTNLEIEDVLSSIRRLVSEDARPRSEPPTEAPERPDRLVLTPAQRVNDVAKGGQDPEMPVADAATPQASEDTRDAKFFKPEPELTTAAVDERSGFITRLVSDEVERMLAAQEDSAPESDVDVAPDPAEDSLSAKIARLEALIARGAAPEAQAEQGENPASATFVHRARDSLDWEDHVAHEDADTFVIESPGADKADPATDVAESTQERVETVTPPALVLGGPPWRGSQVEGGAKDLPVDARKEPGTAVATIDEEMLRDMVGSIVRQELQGALGERITRNVRKLVRREIHRMLVSHELD